MFSDFSSDDEELYEYGSPPFYYPLYPNYDEDGVMDEDFLSLPLEFLHRSIRRRQNRTSSTSKSESVFGGYDYECIKKPSDEFVCPICLLLMRDPVLTSCCGNHFCETCNTESKAKASRCPLCKSTSYTFLIDKGLQRKILDLLAYCPKKSDGCNWQGEIRDVAKHINPILDGCNFIEVKCRLGCNEKLIRHTMEKHITEDCRMRRTTCRYCGFKGEYENLFGPHLSECSEYPISCPNKCTEEKIIRGKIHDHLEKECPLEKISCVFEKSGCTTKVLRKDMQTHIDESKLEHLMLLGQSQVTLQKELDECNSKLSAYKDENANLRTKVDELKTEVSTLKFKVPSSDHEDDGYQLTSPCILLLDKFDQIKRSDSGVWNSPPFYSHPNGYKMQMTIFIDDNIALVIEILEGKFDKHLSWPMKASVSVELLNVIEDNTHWIKKFDDVTGFQMSSVFSRGISPVVECEWFTSCKYLRFFPPKNSQYLEDNKLRFRVTVNVDNCCRPWLI